MGDDNLLFKNKYRIPSARLKGWDYSSTGWYYITIRIKDKTELFGKVFNNVMQLNRFGEIVREEWEKSFLIRKELICNTYIIMPDHIHGLIGIIESNEEKSLKGVIDGDEMKNSMGYNMIMEMKITDALDMAETFEVSGVSGRLDIFDTTNTRDVANTGDYQYIQHSRYIEPTQCYKHIQYNKRINRIPPLKKRNCRNGFPGPYHHLLLVLNRLQPSESMKSVKHPVWLFGNHGFMIGLFVTIKNSMQYNSILMKTRCDGG